MEEKKLANSIGAENASVVVNHPQEILQALEALGFCLSGPTITLLGSMEGATEAEQDAVIQVCAEVLGPLAGRNDVRMVTDGQDDGLAGILDVVSEVGDFKPVGIRIMQEGPSRLRHTHLLTISTQEPLEAMKAQLKIAKALAPKRKSGSSYNVVAILLHGNDQDWDSLCLCMREDIHLVVVGETGGIADKMSQVFSYWRESKPSIWGRPRQARTLSLDALDLTAAGFYSVYRRPSHRVTFLSAGHLEQLYHRLKLELNLCMYL